MYRAYLLPFLLLIALLGPGSAVLAQQLGDRVTAAYKPATVRITARFGGGGAQEGFGFIIGERESELFLVTANHVVAKPGPGGRATSIEVHFHAAPDEPRNARWLKSKKRLDLAVLKVDKPSVAVQWGNASWCSEFQRGDKVWFVGRDRRWFVPLDSEAGDIYEPEPDVDDRLQFAIKSVRPGTSGAPLIHQDGIVGMIVQDGIGNDAEAVSVNKIRRYVKGHGYPWQLRDCGRPGPGPQGKIPFTIMASPEGARVRILNIGPKYRDGIELAAGRYRVEVSKAGYKTHQDWFELSADNQEYSVQLKALAAPLTADGGTVFHDKLKDGGQGPPMVTLPKGCFPMGDSQGVGDPDERPVHSVCVESFAIGVQEVTFQDYDRFADATGREKPKDEGWGRGWRPVINVSWRDALAYTQWLSDQTGRNYALPTEAQWEYGARAGSESKYWWGDALGSNRANCQDCGSQWDGKQTAPVGSFAANPFRLHDTAGNVWEWTCSEYTPQYDGSEQRCVGVDDTSKRVFRGGAWRFGPRALRAASRPKQVPDLRINFIGLRVVRLDGD